jgi:hypothetical protein
MSRQELEDAVKLAVSCCASLVCSHRPAWSNTDAALLRCSSMWQMMNSGFTGFAGYLIPLTARQGCNCYENLPRRRLQPAAA